MLIMQIGVLLACGFGLMPGQSLKAFGGEVLGIGLVMTASPIVIQARQRHVMKTQALQWWLWCHLIALCAGAPVLIGGVYLVAGKRGGLYWLAAGVLVTLAATIWNASVWLVEILR